ncbi:MAG: hypothetical protein JRE14_02525 [Deltaproteobacteria bacterium]|nr:hypothetical protein [Deltaproteobacteria bacterium]
MAPEVAGSILFGRPLEFTASISPKIIAIVGGPIFRSMTAEELDVKGYKVLNDIRHLIDFLLLLQR